ncbi:MAG: MerR family transcriptional regulator [Deltaproteobacteria bacterium]|nr:MerR family transcriptional regulator [Deltaproteobacteria bacterium]MBW2051236.1 MerR family transcriptional regulator [Deltaproteobacteria bacterium]MBW2141157.1 MerR family transcriptional regulator [Deltaproteobacteria bacterium]MBW2322645.1 MerR family transcriptional regulator [Deltaproteobacteria bacterium]
MQKSWRQEKPDYYMINEVSRLVNLSQKRIREYEKEGFLKPDREEKTNNRLYTDFDILQIKRVKYLIHEKGFTLASLRNLMALAPCWNIFGCVTKDGCMAYLNPHRPCWQLRASEKNKSSDSCGRCVIYLNRHLNPEPILVKEQNQW